jgi:ABC-2 type transport system permease protein
MTFLRLLWLFVRLGALREFQYRANFVVQAFQSLLELGTGLATLAVVFAHTATLGGWRPAEVVVLLGVYLTLGGALDLAVRLGLFDFTLARPRDAQLLSSVQEVELWKLTDVALGACTLAAGLWRLERPPPPGAMLAFGAALLAGGVIVYSILLTLATCAFWVVRTDNILNIFATLYAAGRWPVGIYPDWLRVTLTAVVPVAFAVTVPAEVVTGRAGWPAVAGAAAVAAAAFAVARHCWRAGLRRYAGASA